MQTCALQRLFLKPDNGPRGHSTPSFYQVKPLPIRAHPALVLAAHQQRLSQKQLRAHTSWSLGWPLLPTYCLFFKRPHTSLPVPQCSLLALILHNHLQASGMGESPGWDLLEAEKVLMEPRPGQKKTLAVLIKWKTAESNSLLIQLYTAVCCKVLSKPVTAIYHAAV